MLPVCDDFMILSSFEKVLLPETNERNYEQLRFNLVNLGCKVIEFRVSYGEVSERVAKTENLYFITNGQLYDALLLGKKYNQAAILYNAGHKMSVSDTEVGREMWTCNFYNSLTCGDFKIALAKYLSIKNGQENLWAITIEKLHIPTKLESLLRLKNKQGLAQAEWVKLC